jgi:hypothetical protein
MGNYVPYGTYFYFEHAGTVNGTEKTVKKPYISYELKKCSTVPGNYCNQMASAAVRISCMGPLGGNQSIKATSPILAVLFNSAP